MHMLRAGRVSLLFTCIKSGHIKEQSVCLRVFAHFESQICLSMCLHTLRAEMCLNVLRAESVFAHIENLASFCIFLHLSRANRESLYKNKC